MQVDGAQLRDLVEYLRDLGIYDLYRRAGGDGKGLELVAAIPEPVVDVNRLPDQETPGRVVAEAMARMEAAPVASVPPVAVAASPARSAERAKSGAPVGLEQLAPLAPVRVPVADRAAALEQLQKQIGDCTRCPLAYAGRHTIVFGEGDPGARLMFVGEGPGAEEDMSGQPFVGKAGQLLNNMISAMGLRREQVYLANVVKCRTPQDRTPESVEANTCTQFLLQQIDIVQPRVIVALGETAATYVMGREQSLSALRGQWQSCRGAKVAVTFPPAQLLRDPRLKAEAWKDLQRVMVELGLKAPARG